MKKDLSEKELKALGLKKLTLYTPTSVEIENQPSVESDTSSGSFPQVEKLETPKSDAARAAARREKLAELGQTQIAVFVKDLPAFLDPVKELAKRTIKAKTWEEVIEAEPVVAALRETYSSSALLLRIRDLEERHRRAYQGLVFQNEILSTRGIRRIFLYLAGAVDTPIYLPSMRAPTTADESSSNIR